MTEVYFLAQQTMFFAVPLLIVALGGLFSERSGIVNIALEGIMVFGAFSGITFINTAQTCGWAITGDVLLLLALLLAAAVGIAVSLIHACASIHLKADQMISGTAINMLAPAFAIFSGRLISENGTQQIRFENVFRHESIPGLGKIPIIGDLFFKNAYITTYLGVLILMASWVLLGKTRFGLRLRACGEHPQAADAAGINVRKMQYAGVMLSGALAGIGGLVFVIPTSSEFNATVAGYGFLALAVLIFGQWQPLRILMSAFFFGLLKAVASSSSGLSFLANIRIPSHFYKMAPYLITLVALALTSSKSRPPSLGDAER